MLSDVSMREDSVASDENSGASEDWMYGSSAPRRRRMVSPIAADRPHRAGLADLPYEIVLRVVDMHLNRAGFSLADVPLGAERMALYRLRDMHRLRQLEVLLLIDITDAFEPARRLMFAQLPLIDRATAEAALEELTADDEAAAMVRTLWLGAGGEAADEKTLAIFRSIIAICPRLGTLHLDDGVPLSALGPLPSSCTHLYAYNLNVLEAVRQTCSLPV